MTGMTHPYFSIVSVVLNHESGLKTTGESLKIQSFQDYEWIVIDGGSHDGSLSYIKDNATHYISEPDNGIYDAMNKGLAMAAGDYVLFLNAGDALAAPDTLEKIAGAAGKEKNTPDFIYGDSFEAAEGKKTYKPARAHHIMNLGMFTHHQSMLYRRAAIGDLRYDTRYTISADYDFTLRFLRSAKNILYCRRPLCLFEGGGISQQKATLGRTEQFQIRRANRTATIFENGMIYGLQSAAWAFRTHLPGLYWRLKSSRNNRSGTSQI